MMTRTDRSFQAISSVALTFALILGLASSSETQALDLTTFTVEELPPSGFATPVWETTPSSATMQDGLNPTPSFFYSQENVLGTRIRGFITPSTVRGADDDFLGLALGFQPGDATIGPDSPDADYILIDWKGADQDANTGDADGVPPFHDLTPGGLAPVGVAVSRVTGLPTNDEFWQHTTFTENPGGGVVELARGATLGSTPYPRTAGTPVEFDIIYLADRLEVRIDGSLEFELEGSFPDGRLAFYNGFQSEAPSFSDFQLLPPFPPLELQVDPETGFARVTAVGEAPVELRSYTIASDQTPLANEAWSATNLTIRDVDSPPDAGPAERWSEVNAESGQLFESVLRGGSELAPGESLIIGQVLDPAEASAEPELVFDFVSGTPGAIGDSASSFAATVSYGSFPVSPELYGDYNANGVVDAEDYTRWRDGLGGDPGPSGYDLWVANYGRVVVATPGAVPEPAALWMLIAPIVVCTRHELFGRGM